MTSNIVAPKGAHWYPAYIGLGSNLNSPDRQLADAFELLAGIPDTQLISQSSLYRSAPFGGIEQPDFVNAGAALLTRLEPMPLLRELQRIESDRGRVRSDLHWGPRTLDLDLLVYSDVQMNASDLIIPHPGIAERNFVLLPLREVAPGISIPGLGLVSKLHVNLTTPKISRIE